MTKLNLGCWKFKMDGWVNIDIDPSVEPDVIMDATHLAYEDNSIEEIYAGHLLEHLTMNEGVSALREWKRVLIPGGKITITVPDIRKLLDKHCRGETDIEFVQLNAFGAQDREQQNHHMVFDKQVLFDFVRRVFENSEIIDDCDMLVAKVDWQTIVQCTK